MSVSTIVVPCGRMKAEEPCAARQMYRGTGHLAAAAAAAERDGRPWLILSARYGLLDPEQVIAPYEQTLKTKADIATLAARLRMQPNPGPVEAWVPAPYVEAMRQARLTITATPLAGLSLGWQRHWFKEHAA